jgi:hypothetical protein
MVYRSWLVRANKKSHPLDAPTRPAGGGNIIYPVIATRQPWAYAILHCGNDAENRTWRLPAKYIDTPVLLHTGKRIKKEDVIHLIHRGFSVPGHLETGGIVGVLKFSGKEKSQSEWAEECMFHWHIASANPLPFYSCSGQLSFFNVDYPYKVVV